MTMIMIDKAVVEQALAALTHGIAEMNHRGCAIECMPLHHAAKALRAALAAPQPVQEPVAWALQFGDDVRICLSTVFDTRDEAQDYASSCIDKTELTPLYTSPQAAQPLSDDKLEQIEAVVKELTETLEDLADYAGAFSVSGVYLVEDKHARALLAQAYKLVLKYDN